MDTWTRARNYVYERTGVEVSTVDLNLVGLGVSLSLFLCIGTNTGAPKRFVLIVLYAQPNVWWSRHWKFQCIFQSLACRERRAGSFLSEHLSFSVTTIASKDKSHSFLLRMWVYLICTCFCYDVYMLTVYAMTHGGLCA